MNLSQTQGFLRISKNSLSSHLNVGSGALEGLLMKVRHLVDGRGLRFGALMACGQNSDLPINIPLTERMCGSCCTPPNAVLGNRAYSSSIVRTCPR